MNSLDFLMLSIANWLPIILVLGVVGFALYSFAYAIKKHNANPYPSKRDLDEIKEVLRRIEEKI